MTTLKLVAPGQEPKPFAVRQLSKQDSRINFKITAGYDAAVKLILGWDWGAPLVGNILRDAFNHLEEVSRAHWDAHLTDQSGAVRTKAEQKGSFVNRYLHSIHNRSSWLSWRATG
jgi:hypothetical protein